MPQLMPLFWNLSLLMTLYIMIMMSLFYFMKLLEYDLIYLNIIDDKLIVNQSNLTYYKW